MTPIVLTVPMPYNIANQKTHPLDLHRRKKRYFVMLDTRQNYGMIPPPPTTPWPHVRVTAVMTLPKQMDHDNAKYRCYKWPMDWLRTRGYIASDAPSRCTMDDPTQVVQRGTDQTITFTITPHA